MATRRSAPGSDRQKRRRTPHQKFLPNRPVLLITGTGPKEIAPEQVSADNVGCKATGLSVLPIDWTLPYFVVSAQCFEEHVSREALNRWVADGSSRIGLSPGAPLMIRSSGTAETMRDRGSLFSKRTSLEVSDAIDELRAKIAESARPQVHWIVQEAVNS